MSLHKTLTFLTQIKENNHREWFADHNEEYQEAKQEVTAFAKSLYSEMCYHDQIDESKIKVFRIFRDVRFGKDKTLFKSHWSCGYQRVGVERRGGYYFSIEPDNTFIAGGFFGPNPQDLSHIRKQISLDPEPMRKILDNATFVDTFGNLQGDQLKTAPKGFEKDDPAIDLLRYKQIILRHHFTDEEVMSPDFDKRVSDVYAKMRPFLDYMTEILTTDLNGVSIIH
ncbi:MAG: DUF2461 domain-containing protein [Cyclobacteriaceae bacterium]